MHFDFAFLILISIMLFYGDIQDELLLYDLSLEFLENKINPD